MLRRSLLLLMIFAILPTRAAAEPIHWAEFDIPWESLDYAMNVDIRSVDSEQHMTELKQAVNRCAQKDVEIRTVCQERGRGAEREWVDLTKVIKAEIEYID